MVKEYLHSLTFLMMPYHSFKIDLVSQIQRILNVNFVSLTNDVCIIHTILGLLSVFQTKIMLQITSSLLANDTHTELPTFIHKRKTETRAAYPRHSETINSF